MSRRMTLIAAHARNRVIGRAGDMPWHLPDDLKHFMRATLGGVVVMGRKTFESLKGPLPRRRNIVITRNSNWQHEGVERVLSLAEALDMAGEDSVHIAGGGEIYQAAFPMATHLDLTEIDAAPDGDTYFPEFDLSEWHEVACEHHPADERHAHAFTFRMYERAAASIAD
ncbi:MAG: dihydrofolate reductase [Phycisphaeraceae bacterium]|nr:MAG: dihydrofolate reductase [Phycisphaeraceae bacterium]